MENQNKQNVEAKAVELREKLENESLDKCKVAGGRFDLISPENSNKK